MSLFDCIVIGGGPAGLSAAIYLSRHHLLTRLFDCGTSRAGWIPCSHNLSGYANGISGDELLIRIGDYAAKYGVKLTYEEVTELRSDGHIFSVRTPFETVRARCVLLATGVINRSPSAMDRDLHERALRAGRVRYSPLCDGFEVTDKHIAMIGKDDHALAEAMFLRSSSNSITLIPDSEQTAFSKGRIQEAKDAEVVIVGQPAEAYFLEEDTIIVKTRESNLRFDPLYPALGSDIRSSLAGMCDASLDKAGCIVVDEHMRTTVVALYAAGDVVVGLNHISNAMGQAGVASTTIRNDLAEKRSLLR